MDTENENVWMQLMKGISGAVNYHTETCQKWVLEATELIASIFKGVCAGEHCFISAACEFGELLELSIIVNWRRAGKMIVFGDKNSCPAWLSSPPYATTLTALLLRTIL